MHRGVEREREFSSVQEEREECDNGTTSEANDTATTTDAALTKGRRKRRVSVMKKTEFAVGTSGYRWGDLFSYFQSQIQTQIEDANKKIQDAANKTLEISDSMVKEIGSVATDVTDKLTARRDTRR